MPKPAHEERHADGAAPAAKGSLVTDGASPPVPGKEPPRASRRRRQPLPPAVWASWDDEQLLSLRFCDLDIAIETSDLGSRLGELQGELSACGLRFQPHTWLSYEFFTPDGVPGFAIPFYLAHPRLARLELHQMLEVEGGTHEWCMKILRHEAGHAIENAFGIKRKRRRRELFGRTTVPYPERYTPRPYSKSFVLHLDPWYAQSHPDEDFAETFAVWLTPGSRWRERYQGWPALKKLEYMDALITSLAGKAPVVASEERMDPLDSITKTLRRHYEEKRVHYGVDHPKFYDRDLRRLFSDAPGDHGQPTAASFIIRTRREVRRLVGRWTNVYQYTIDRVLDDMIVRCRELNLRLRPPSEHAKLDFAVLLAVQTMNYLHSGRHRVAL